MTHLLVHYHLRPGGVTRVLLEEAAALKERGHPFAIISAGPTPSMPWNHLTIPALDYATTEPSDIEALWNMLQSSVQNLPTPHIWHIHNPTLGCHNAMAEIVHRLASQQQRLLLHVHDFAEDARPDNLKRLAAGPPWFPIGPRIHYLALTKRDQDHLIAAGLPRSHVTIVANPIRPHPLPPPPHRSARILYPTRAITRKNIGEMLLLAAIAPAGSSFATTLGPGLSQHQENYVLWQHLARKLALPIEWAIAEQGPLSPTLDDCVRDATHLLTTSCQEGFGMAFHESIAWQRPLIGRAIPHVQENLARYGILHPYLYEQIRVDGIDFARQTAQTQACLIEHARSEASSVDIIHNDMSIRAVDWWQDALSAHHQSLPLTLLDAFHPQRHIDAITAIAEKLAEAAEGPIAQLDHDRLRRAFSA